MRKMLSKLSNLSKKQKVVALCSAIVVVCGLAVATMYATGVLPGQTKGMIGYACTDPNCSCHTVILDANSREAILCHKCDHCKGEYGNGTNVSTDLSYQTGAASNDK